MFMLLRYSGAASRALQTQQGLQQQRRGWIGELRACPGMVSACLIPGVKELRVAEPGGLDGISVETITHPLPSKDAPR